MTTSGPLTILHLDDGREWRGGQQQVSLLCREQVRSGHRPVILCPPGSPLARWAAEAGIPAREARLAGELHPASVAAVRREVTALRPLIVHAHTSHAHTLALLAARGPGRPLRVVARRLAGRPPRGLSARLKYGRRVDLFIAVAGAVGRELVAAGVEPEQVAVVPSAIDPARFASPPPREAALSRFGLPAGCRLVGTLGSLVPQKSHADLVAAFARLAPGRPDLHLVILGEGPLRPDLLRQARDLGLASRIHLPGFRADAGALVPHLAVLALPSVFEGMPNALLDGLAAGVPVVATPAGGTREVLGDDEGGLVVPFHAPRRLAEAIARLLDHPGEARRLMEEGRRRVLAGHVPQALAAGTEAAYRVALERRAAGGEEPPRGAVRSWSVEGPVDRDLRRVLLAEGGLAAEDTGRAGPTGRGPVWRGSLGGRAAVLTQHRRGGLGGRLLRPLPGGLDALYLGDGRLRRTRAVTARFRARGGAAPEALAWLSRRRGLLRQLYSASAEWRGGLTADQILDRSRKPGREAWLAAAGRALARWHQAGLVHPDLNLGNILARQPAGRRPGPGDLVVIDLDGAALAQRPGTAVRARALARLERSALKVLGREAPGPRQRLRLLAAYGREWAEHEGKPPQEGDRLVRRLLPALRRRRRLFPLHGAVRRASRR